MAKSPAQDFKTHTEEPLKEEDGEESQTSAEYATKLQKKGECVSLTGIEID